MPALTTPISGKNGKITYGSGPTTAAVTGWKYTPKGNPIDVSNSTDGRRRIAGLPDCDLSFDMHVDTAATLEADLAPGGILTFNAFTDGTKKFGPVTAIVDSIDYANEVEGTYDASVKCMLASGSIPAAPA